MPAAKKMDLDDQPSSGPSFFLIAAAPQTLDFKLRATSPFGKKWS